jgi:hypothetical protein
MLARIATGKNNPMSSLTLRRTVINDCRPPDDYEVMSNGRPIGRIYKPHAGAPADRPWEWTITRAVVAPARPSYGFEPTFDEAKAAFKAVILIS